MLTLDRKAQPLALREQRALQPTILAGLLFAALEVVPLTAEGPVTPMRAVGTCFLLVAATGLIVAGLPRSRRRPLPERGRGGRPTRLDFAGEALPPIYRALLVFSDGSREVVLEGSEPARVLMDAALLGRQLAIPLGPGWGLGESSLTDLAGSTHSNDRRFALDDRFVFEQPPFAGQRAAAYTMLWASVFVPTATFVMAAGPERHGLVPSNLSLTLPCVGALVLLVIGLWLLGFRERIELTAASVTQQRLWFRFPLSRPDVRVVTVTSAALVRPASGTAGHLLVASEAGLLALPAESREGPRLLHERGAPTPVAGRAAE